MIVDLNPWIIAPPCGGLTVVKEGFRIFGSIFEKELNTEYCPFVILSFLFLIVIISRRILITFFNFH